MVDATTLTRLLETAVDDNGRRSAIRTTLAALQKFPEAHVRPLYAALLRAVAAEASAIAADALEAEWDLFAEAVSVFETNVIALPSPVTWPDRALVVKQLVNLLPPTTDASKPFNAVLTVLSNAASATVTEDDKSDFARTSSEVRAANEALRAFVAAHPFATVIAPATPALTAALAATTKTLLAGNDISTVERLVAIALFDKTSLRFEVDVDASLQRLREAAPSTPAYGRHLIVYAGAAIAEQAALLNDSSDEVVEAGRVSPAANAIWNIAAFVDDLRPKVIRVTPEVPSDVIKGMTRLITCVIATIQHAIERNDIDGVLKALCCLARVLTRLFPASVANAENSIDLRKAVSQGLHSAALQLIPDDQTTWDETLDFGVVDALLECVVQAGFTNNVLRCDDGFTPVLHKGVLTALAARAKAGLNEIAPLVTASATSGKRGRDRRPKKDEAGESDMSRFANTLRSIERRAETLARFMEESPAQGAFAISQIRCGQVSW